MLRVGEIFVAQADSLWDTVNCHGGSSGFRIPEYQRTYDWSQERIGRLLEDCANGLGQLRKQGTQESFTFLGTLILVNERSESTFNGRSLAVVDGQQRLTTLLLICCALVEKISANLGLAEDLPQDARVLILGEAERHIGLLFACIFGELRSFQQKGRYPRIIRHEDKRATQRIDADYKSTISKFLMDFAEHYSSTNLERKEFSFQRGREDHGTSRRLRANYEFIKQQVTYIAGLQSHGLKEDEIIDCEVVASNDFNLKGFTNLLPKIDRRQDDRIVSAICKQGKPNVLTRLVLFASYMSQCVVLTRVETEDQESAFDIFDALNTTGEPLTAIETFRPLVIKTEKQQASGYRGSPSEIEFDEIESVFKKIDKPADRQTEARELVISFALYANGEKIPKDLRQQRRYLRRSFEKRCETLKSKRRFVKSLAEMTQFRSECWNRDGIRETTNLESSARLCLQFIRDMNSSLALPIIARYWSKRHETSGEIEFVTAVHALTAFLVLRRSVTGSTGGIDAVFRSIMRDKSEFGAPLCTGLKSENQLVEADRLKAYLRSLLADKQIEVTDKKSWIENAKEVPIGRHTSVLAKFLILAASQYATPDSNRPGLLTRKGFRESGEQDYLTYENWTAAEYKTIEHVAPATNPGHGWDPEIYVAKRFVRDLVGNLALLPQKENASLGNSPWKRKKLFYLALTEPDKAKQEDYLRQAEAKNLEFPKNTKALIRQGRRLHLLDPVRNVDEWDESFILARTENILSLAWDRLEEWLWK